MIRVTNHKPVHKKESPFFPFQQQIHVDYQQIESAVHQQVNKRYTHTASHFTAVPSSTRLIPGFMVSHYRIFQACL